MNNFNHKIILREKVKPYDVRKIQNFDDALKALRNCGFQGRNLGLALEILYQMLSDKDCLSILTLSGAMIPAGMGNIIAELIDNKLIDILVSTGANIMHDFIDAVSHGGHYLGHTEVDDEYLYDNRINRIYNVFLPEDYYDKAEQALFDLILKVFPSKKIKISPSDFFYKIGKELRNRSILSTAAKHNVPIFIPAISDSELALDLVKFTKTKNFEVNFNALADIEKFASFIESSESCGTFIIGGGVPRNWAQQIFPYIENVNGVSRKNSNLGYKYSVRIHTATEYDGGLSGCTISESKSWGKYTSDARYVSVWCDATIALPFLITALFQRLDLM